MVDSTAPRHSIVIPLRFGHRRFALRLVESIRSWEYRPCEIIVAASEVPHQGQLELQRQLAYVSGMDSERIRLVATPDPATAGVNRNTGWAEAESDWTLFLDADDIYRPERSQLLLDLCKEHFAEAAFHSFAYLESPRRFLQGCLRRGPGTEILTRDIRQPGLTQSDLAATRVHDRQGSSNLLLPPHGPKAIHHGHLTIKTELRDRFSFLDVAYGEDGLLAQELVRASIPIVATPWILSLYDPWRWRLPLTELARNAKRKAGNALRPANGPSN